MSWIKREHEKRDFTYKFINPEKSNDYWVTDGYYVFRAHYDKDSNSWGIYQPDKFGVWRTCLTLDDMNFRITAWQEIKVPKPNKKFQE